MNKCDVKMLIDYREVQYLCPLRADKKHFKHQENVRHKSCFHQVRLHLMLLSFSEYDYRDNEMQQTSNQLCK